MKRIAGWCLVLMIALSACQSTTKEGSGDNEMRIASEADSQVLIQKNEQLPSPRRTSSGLIGTSTVTLDWGAPAVKDRTIWGELVPWGEIWRAGANENTTISFDDAVVIRQDTIPAGKYGLFIIPQENEDWKVVLSEKNDSWGHFEYSKSEDILRTSVQPEKVDKLQERLVFEVTKDGVSFSWEYVTFTLPISA